MLLLDLKTFVKARPMFVVSILLALSALVLVLIARGQLEHGLEFWRGGNPEVFREFSHRGGKLLILSYAVALGSVACLFMSYRRREPGRRWGVLVLLGFFAILGFSPV